MGSQCCKAPLDPNKVHIKKINEIFINCNPTYLITDSDLKNQGIDTSQKNTAKKGSDVLDD